jgi:valyl-tRNA synthetase
MFAPAVTNSVDINWQEALQEGPAQVNVAQLIYEAVRSARNLRAEYRIASNRKIRFLLRPIGEWVEEDVRTMARLIGASEVVLDSNFKPVPGVPMVIIPHGELYMPLEGVINKAAESERLDKEIARIEKELRTVEDKLKNESFVERAPPDVVEEHRRRLRDFNAQLTKLKQAREGLN